MGSLHWDLRHWVNDALMTIFFLVIGLEVKRELTTGRLRDPRRASLPILAAPAGAAVPAIGVDPAKVTILAASLVAGLLGAAVLFGARTSAG